MPTIADILEAWKGIPAILEWGPYSPYPPPPGAVQGWLGLRLEKQANPNSNSGCVLDVFDDFVTLKCANEPGPGFFLCGMPLTHIFYTQTDAGAMVIEQKPTPTHAPKTYREFLMQYQYMKLGVLSKQDSDAVLVRGHNCPDSAIIEEVTSDGLRMRYFQGNDPNYFPACTWVPFTSITIKDFINVGP